MKLKKIIQMYQKKDIDMREKTKKLFEGLQTNQWKWLQEQMLEFDAMKYDDMPNELELDMEWMNYSGAKKNL